MERLEKEESIREDITLGSDVSLVKNPSVHSENWLITHVSPAPPTELEMYVHFFPCVFRELVTKHFSGQNL